ncbi:cobalt ECF transporter T component CbiQ [Desulfurobacterium thermolithotrophum]|uniref:cobalt ECF transporter T component CbiQ n=1 Tax=Desulfurobacterium thermolithotrophum TaxID=64160 RepID=UPI0013D7DE20|nr:cobalt ECF transporter T component CbiQ [Desulfurobacterium thermolithotrophum]
MENKLSQRQTLLHEIDPRVKIIVFLLFAWGIALTPDFKEALLFIPFISILLIVTGKNALKALKPLLFANTFLIFIVLSMIFTYESPNMLHFGFLSLSIDGLKYGLFLFLKSNEILILMLLLLSTSSVFSIFHALHHLKLPNKLTQLLFFTYRYIYTIKDEYNIMMKAAKCRGFKPKTSIFTYKTFAYILGNLLVRSYRKADKIYKAMLCRGFKGAFPVYSHFSFSTKDIIFALLSTMFFLVVELWKF